MSRYVAKKKLLMGLGGYRYTVYLEGPEILIEHKDIEIRQPGPDGIPFLIHVPAQERSGTVTNVKLFYDGSLLLQGPVMWANYDAGVEFTIVVTVQL